MSHSADAGGPVGRVAWLDVSAGASGDMLLGALVDAGADLSAMDRAVAAVGPVHLACGHEQREGLRVARVTVVSTEVDPPHRTWRDVRGLLSAAELPDAVRALALDAFSRLATAEATVHGTTPDDVHFHEVGAHDAIGDVVGVAAGVVDLRSRLGVASVHATPVALGGGTARTAHGTIPVPGPAVLELVRAGRVPSVGGPDEMERCTPTGAALLAAVVDAWGPMPAMTVDAVGVGAGTRVTPGRLNAVRLVLGEPLGGDVASGHGGSAYLLETNVDDLDPRVWPHVLSTLLTAGADDAWLTPILMKKGRPAHTLHVLTGRDPVVLQRVREVVLTETSAIGLRVSPVGKFALDREMHEVDVEGQPVRVKVALLAGRVVNSQPEYDDVVAAAVALGRPVKVVLAAATAAARQAGAAG